MRGITFANNHALSADSIFASIGDDKKVNLWSLNKLKEQAGDDPKQSNAARTYQARATYLSKTMLSGLDHSYSEDLFATAGGVV